MAALALTYVRRPDVPGGRIIAMSGSVQVGTIWPPHVSQQDSRWDWALWIGEQHRERPRGSARRLDAAMQAIEERWEAFVIAAGLAVAAAESKPEEQ